MCHRAVAPGETVDCAWIYVVVPEVSCWFSNTFLTA